MSTNPYAGALAGRDPAQMMAGTPARWRAYVSGLTAEEIAQSPAPGKWSVREVLCHLADCELAFGFRMRQVYAGEPVIQPFDQDQWARAYAAYTAEQALDTFLALRTWNTAFVGGLTEADKVQSSLHPERGATKVWDVVETLAGHDLHHLEKLERLGA